MCHGSGFLFLSHPVPSLVLSLSGPGVFSTASCPLSVLTREASILTQKYGAFFPNFLDCIETAIPLAPTPEHTTKVTFAAVGKHISLFGFQCDPFSIPKATHHFQEQEYLEEDKTRGLD